MFERLLVGKSDVKAFLITNPGLLPIKWKLTGLEGLPKELKIEPTEGTIAPRSEEKVGCAQCICLVAESVCVCLLVWVCSVAQLLKNEHTATHKHTQTHCTG